MRLARNNHRAAIVVEGVILGNVGEILLRLLSIKFSASELRALRGVRKQISNSIPKQLNISSKQFGTKLGRRLKDLGIDAGKPINRYKFKQRLKRIFGNADEVRVGTYRGQGLNNTEGTVYFFRRGTDVVVTKSNGDYVTILLNGSTSRRFLNGTKIR